MSAKQVSQAAPAPAKALSPKAWGSDTIRVGLKDKLKIEGTPVQVSFAFSADDRLTALELFTNNVKEPAFNAAVGALTARFGPPIFTRDTETRARLGGTQWERRWYADSTAVYLVYVTERWSLVQVVRLMSLAAHHPVSRPDSTQR
jgi:hypothetical protein